MAIDFAALNPQELIVLLVALAGLVPVLTYRRAIPRWVLAPYAFLLIGAVMTNVENLLWHDLLNYIEHSIGNLGAGLAMAVASYVGSRWHQPPSEEFEP